VEWTEEKTYMFKLSLFHEQIEQWITDKKPLYPVKYNKLALIQLNELKKQGDISISREDKRLSWGIQVSFRLVHFRAYQKYRELLREFYRGVVIKYMFQHNY